MIQVGAERDEGARSKQNRYSSLRHLKLSPLSAFDPTGEQQEHLDAVVCFAGAGQRRHLFWRLDILTIK